MLVKWIEIEVDSAHRMAFDADQRAWASLSDAPGFVGQIGGWRTERAAVVLGYWADEAAYAHFMAALHDPIWEGAQTAPIASIEIEIWEAVLPMPGAAADLPNAMAVATALSWLEWCPRDDGEGLMTLAELHPRLMPTPGHLGSLGTRRCAPLRYRVPSLWGPGDGAVALGALDGLTLPPGAQLNGLSLEPAWTILPGGVEPVG